jgi:predicted lactoylglutathione lyase
MPKPSREKPHAHISLITLGVSDVGRSSRFYEALGFVRKMKQTGNEVAFLEAGGIVLACWGAEALAAEAGFKPPAAGSFRGVSIAWNCETEKDVETVVAMAVAAGGVCLKTPQRAVWGGFHGHFADPDGHVWEVAHNPQFPLSPDGKPSLPD